MKCNVHSENFGPFLFLPSFLPSSSSSRCRHNFAQLNFFCTLLFHIWWFSAAAATKRNNICLSEECVRTASSLISSMNPSVDPCVNFFEYACGTWNKIHGPIPEDRSSISTFEVLADQQQFILRNLLEEPISQLDHSATIKAKKFYASCMDIREWNSLFYLIAYNPFICLLQNKSDRLEISLFSRCYQNSAVGRSSRRSGERQSSARRSSSAGYVGSTVNQ